MGCREKNTLQVQHRAIECLQFLPIFFIYTGLFKNSRQQIPADISTMWIRNTQSNVALDHELMFPARIGSFEAEFSQIS